MMGPLAGYRVVEFGGIGPGPMCAMLLADMGASVIRIDRTVPNGLGIPRPARYDLLNRGRVSVKLDLKQPADVETALALVECADALIEGYRPGVMERLGLGPDDCLKRNPRLAYGRMTGWGQEGPLAPFAGHDINYIALTGVLHAIGRRGDAPVPPLNLIGDFGGGAIFLAFGLVCALLEARASGRGQVVDAAMIDGAAYLMTSFYGMHAYGGFKLERGTNITDTGAYYWETYPCADGEYVALGPIEPKFRAVLLRALGLDQHDPPLDEMPPDAAKAVLAATFLARPRQEWVELLQHTDACFAPVLSMADAPLHPQNRARQTFVEVGGVVQPGPAPRFSRSIVSKAQIPENDGGAHLRATLAKWGLAAECVEKLAGDVPSDGRVASRGA